MKRVDLFTHSKRLQELVLSDCPIRFNPSTQHIIDRTKEPDLYIFENMPYSLLKYLDNSELPDDADYEVRNSHTGNIIMIRKSGVVVYGTEIINEMLRQRFINPIQN